MVGPKVRRRRSDLRCTQISLEDVENTLRKCNVDLNDPLLHFNYKLLRSLCAEMHILPIQSNFFKITYRVEKLKKKNREKILEPTIREVTECHNPIGIDFSITNGNASTDDLNVDINSDCNFGKQCTKLKYVDEVICERLQECAQKNNIETRIEHRRASLRPRRPITDGRLTRVYLGNVEAALLKCNVDLNDPLFHITSKLLTSLCAELHIVPIEENKAKVTERIERLIKKNKEKLLKSTNGEVNECHNPIGIDYSTTNGNINTVDINSDCNFGNQCTKLKYVDKVNCERLQECVQNNSIKTKIEHRTASTKSRHPVTDGRLIRVFQADVEAALLKYNVDLNDPLFHITSKLLTSLCADLHIEPIEKNKAKITKRIKTLIKKNKEKLLKSTNGEVNECHNPIGIDYSTTNGNINTVDINSDCNFGKQCTKLKYVDKVNCERLQECTQNNSIKTKIEHRTATATAGKNSVVIQTECDCINVSAEKTSVVVKTKCLDVPIKHKSVEVKITCGDFRLPGTKNNFEVNINCIDVNTSPGKCSFVTNIEYGMVNVSAGQTSVLVNIPDENINVSAGENNIIVKTNCEALTIPSEENTETVNKDYGGMILPLEPSFVKVYENKYQEDNFHFDTASQNVTGSLKESNIDVIRDYENEEVPMEEVRLDLKGYYECINSISGDDIIEVIIDHNGENVSVDQSSVIVDSNSETVNSIMNQSGFDSEIDCEHLGVLRSKTVVK